MRHNHGHWPARACVVTLLLASPALARAQAPAPAPEAPSASPATPAAPPPATPAAPTAPVAPAAPPAPAVAPSEANTLAPPASAAAPPPVPEVQLAPDPKLAPAVPLAPAPGAQHAQTTPVQPDLPLASSEPEATAALLPMFDLRLGLRDQLIKDDSFDAFAEDDQLPAFQLAAGVCLHNLASGGAVAGVASLELGGTSASLRGLPTELDVLRIGLGPELRIPVAERLFVSGRLSPQAVRVSTRLDQSQAAALSFSDEQWTFGVDANIAADLRLAQVRPAGLQQPLGLFVRLEAGYAWSPSLELDLRAANGPVRSAPLPLGELALHGLSFGASVGVGY